MNRKVEEYVKKYTRHGSNELSVSQKNDGEEAKVYHEWLMPADAYAAATIAEDEIMRKLMDHGYTFGAAEIAHERQRQIEQEGYTETHDRHHTPQTLCRAAAAYALQDDPSRHVASTAYGLWPWSVEYWKPKDHLRNLVRAGALIAAAIDRIHAEDGGCSEPSPEDRMFIRSAYVSELAGGVLYVTVNLSERWLDATLFDVYPGKGLMQISFYKDGEVYPETFRVSDDFDQFDYQFTSSTEKDQMTIVCIPVGLLIPSERTIKDIDV